MTTLITRQSGCADELLDELRADELLLDDDPEDVDDFDELELELELELDELLDEDEELLLDRELEDELDEWLEELDDEDGVSGSSCQQRAFP